MTATDPIREKMDYDDAKMQDTIDKEEGYKTQMDTLMTWAHQKAVNSKDKGTNSSKMDMGGAAGKDGWDHQQQDDYYIGMMKETGKDTIQKRDTEARRIRRQRRRKEQRMESRIQPRQRRKRVVWLIPTEGRQRQGKGYARSMLQLRTNRTSSKTMQERSKG